MRKIGTTHELAGELRRVLRYAQSHNPSRTVLAAELAGLADRVSMEHATPAALKTYLKEHPDADPKNHKVKKTRSDESPLAGKPWGKYKGRSTDQVAKEMLKDMSRGEAKALAKDAWDHHKKQRESGHARFFMTVYNHLK